MMVDLCGWGWKDESQNDAHCLVRAHWRVSRGSGVWLGSAPLQMGGLAQTPPRPEDHGWREAPTHHHLTGCLSRLIINTQVIIRLFAAGPHSQFVPEGGGLCSLMGNSFMTLLQVMDLGEVAHSYDSVAGCRPQDAACSDGCGVRGQCVGGLQHPQCKCEPGWTGPGCVTPTVPARFKASSYLKVALSFSPDPWMVRVQVRVRLQGARSGLLLQLAARHRSAALTLHVRLKHTHSC